MKRAQNSLNYINSILGRQFITNEGYLLTIVGALNAKKYMQSLKIHM